MPYEDDYKAWLEKMLIESNPDWVCDEMYDAGFTHEWCEKYCGEDSEYVTPKCLHMYYHHIVKAEQTEPSSSERPNNCEPQFDKDINVRSKDEPYIDIETGILHWCGWKYKRIYEDEPQTDVWEYHNGEWTEPQTDCAWR